MATTKPLVIWATVPWRGATPTVFVDAAYVFCAPL